MKLIYFTKRDNFYVARALQEVQLLGITLYRKISDFKLPESNGEWANAKSGRKASDEQEKQLNKWLDDHKKYIEKR